MPQLNIQLTDKILDKEECLEKQQFVFQSMLTCIGNKRKLVGYIHYIVESVKQFLQKDKLNIVDGFSGSTVVSRELSYSSDNLYMNDLELYSYLMAKCYIVKPTNEQQFRIKDHITNMNDLAENGPYKEGIICKHYSPQNTHNIKEGERCFYTRENALIIDTLRDYIDTSIEEDIRTYCLVPLLTKASIHTNTAGVFKGFYKHEGIGCFGGTGKNALSRITKPIRLDIPVWNPEDYKAHVFNRDINELIDELPNTIDIIYLDPPYNQHPYGSNYFMLNVIAKNQEPENISKVSGIPKHWNKSAYNSRTSAIDSMKSLLEKSLNKSKYVLISYNDEGIIKKDEWKTLLKGYKVKKYEIVYDTYKGSRNLRNRNDKVMEIMYLISKSTL